VFTFGQNDAIIDYHLELERNKGQTAVAEKDSENGCIRVKKGHIASESVKE
jgi:hypothetical protein